MPRSPAKIRRRVWRPLRQFPSEGSDAYHRTLIGPRAYHLMRRHIGKVLLRGIREGKAIPGEKKGQWTIKPEFHAEMLAQKEKLENIMTAGEAEAKRRIPKPEKEGLRNVLNEQMRALSRDTVMHSFFKKWVDPSSTFEDNIDSLRDVLQIAAEIHLTRKDPEKELGSVGEIQAWERAGGRFEQLMVHMALCQIVHRHIAVMRIPASYLEVSHAIQSNFGAHPGFEILNDMPRILLLEREIEHEIVLKRKAQRLEARRNEIDLAPRMKRMKRLLIGFDMSRHDRKNVYREAREILAKKRFQKETDAVRTIAVRAFKRSREQAERVLRGLNIDVPTLFTSMGIITKQKLVTTEAMRNLKRLNEIIRTHPDPVERKRRIIALMGENPGLTQTAIHRIVPLENGEQKPAPAPRNPRKEEERRARKDRQDKEEKARAAARSANAPKEIPTSLNGLLGYFRDEHTISREALVSLRRVLHRVDPKMVSRDSLVHAIEYSILCEMATHHKKSGRVSERGLRAETTPERLSELFKAALANLVHRNDMKYDSHYGSREFIALHESSASRILGKYDTKERNHNGGNGE